MARAAEEAPAERRSPFAYRNFRLFFAGNLISSSGTWLQNVAQGVLVLRLTGKSVLVGAAQAATFVPVLLLSLHGGQLADRYDRRKLLVLTQVLAIVATASLAVLAAFDRVGVPAIMVVAVLLGIQYALALPASQAMVPSLVPPEVLGPAIGMTSVTYNLARVIGPLFATVTISALGFGWAFGLNSLSFLALALAVLAIHPRPLAEGPHGAVGAAGSIREGLVQTWRNPSLRLLLYAVTAISFATDPVFTLSPAFSENVFGRTATDAGLLVSGFGVGAILAALALGRLLRKPSGGRSRVSAAGISVMAIGMATFALMRSFPLAILALAVSGGGYLIAISTVTTSIHEEVPDSLRGRVMAIWTLCFLGSRPIAAILDGALADRFSPEVAAFVMLLPAVVAAAALGWEASRGRGHTRPRSGGAEFASG